MERLVIYLRLAQAALVLIFIFGLAVGHAALNSGNGWQGAVAVMLIGFSGLTLLRSTGA